MYRTFEAGDRVVLNPHEEINNSDTFYLKFDTVYTVERVDDADKMNGGRVFLEGQPNDGLGYFYGIRFLPAPVEQTPKAPKGPTFEDGLRVAAKIARDNGDYKTASDIMWELIGEDVVARIVRENPNSVIEAIKALRAEKGLRLKDAKDAVDAERVRQGLSQPR